MKRVCLLLSMMAVIICCNNRNIKNAYDKIGLPMMLLNNKISGPAESEAE